MLSPSWRAFRFVKTSPAVHLRGRPSRLDGITALSLGRLFCCYCKALWTVGKALTWFPDGVMPAAGGGWQRRGGRLDRLARPLEQVGHLRRPAAMAWPEKAWNDAIMALRAFVRNSLAVSSACHPIKARVGKRAARPKRASAPCGVLTLPFCAQSDGPRPCATAHRRPGPADSDVLRFSGAGPRQRVTNRQLR